MTGIQTDSTGETIPSDSRANRSDRRCDRCADRRNNSSQLSANKCRVGGRGHKPRNRPRFACRFLRLCPRPHLLRLRPRPGKARSRLCLERKRAAWLQHRMVPPFKPLILAPYLLFSGTSPGAPDGSRSPVAPGEAVDCRNHFVHGSKANMDYTVPPNQVIFFTQVLGMVLKRDAPSTGWTARTACATAPCSSPARDTGP